MKASQRVALEMSEKREKLNGLLGVDDLTERSNSAPRWESLTSRLQELEVEARAAIMAEDEIDGHDAATVVDGENSRACDP